MAGEVGNDSLVGGDGSDTLIGRGGNDTHQGGTGAGSMADVVRSGAPDAGNDTIAGFVASDDAIEVSAAGFGGGLAPGEVGADQFAANAAGIATAAAGRFIYDTDDGALLWDADGTGPGAAVLLAMLSGAPPLAGSDIDVLA